MVKVLIRDSMTPLRNVPGLTFKVPVGFALTVNTFLQMIFVVPAPPVTVIFPVHCGAFSAAVMFTVIWLALFTFTLFTVIPVSPTVTLTPLTWVKSIFCTATVTSTVTPASTAEGATLTHSALSGILVVVVVVIIDVVAADVVAADIVELVVLAPPPPWPPETEVVVDDVLEVVGSIDVVVVAGCVVVVVTSSVVVLLVSGNVVVVSGITVVVVTGAAVTVNAAEQVTVSPPVVAVTLRAPNVAPESMVIVAITSVAKINTVLLTVIPVPLKDATVTPLEKLVFKPVIVTSRVAP